MRSNLLVLSGAAVALAGPVKRDAVVNVVVETDVVIETEITWYTVTAEVSVTAAAPTTTAPNVVDVVTVTVAPSSTTTPEAANVNVVDATTSTSTTAAAASASPTDFADIAVYHHNIHRTNSSADAVTYDDTIAGYAATLAARCVFEHDITIGDGTYGQNIAMYAATDLDTVSQTDYLAMSITDEWFNSEIELYPLPYGENPDMSNFDAWGHYSQVVWKGTKQVGCAVQRCAAGTMEPTMDAWFSVCNYLPAGNVDTEYGDNVGAPLGDATINVGV